MKFNWFKFEISNQLKLVTQIICYFVIEVILLAYYSQGSSLTKYSNEFDQYRSLSITGCVFMMINFLILGALNFKYHIYAVYFLIVFIPFSVFLILIGMGLAASLYNSYNYPVAFWFINLCLLFESFIVLHKLKNKNSTQKEINKNNYAPAQQQQK